MTLLGRVLTKCAKISGFIIQSTAIAYCVVEFCGGLVICSGSSMEPTIQNNDIILTEQVSVHMHNIRRSGPTTGPPSLEQKGPETHTSAQLFIDPAAETASLRWSTPSAKASPLQTKERAQQAAELMNPVVHQVSS
ncbi:uncharacterized protein LOC8043966 isoform X2 [Ixodes scapularis]|uniref:uncharacterized protein LOC8043966 isoform X2 n=1 Tax=Ixodes scapularis TaxID=6945 RepID=UPI001A9E1192|nr:uncharacterized protein LOC8043966 isoform X2 [Ixodes scapularis]